MKNFLPYIVLNLLLSSVVCYGQNSDKILNDYLSAINKIKTVSYNIQRIDTFTTGDVWNHKGKCIIQRDEKDSLFAFHFLGSRSDVQEYNLYDGHQMFSITDSSKSYTVINKPGVWILGFTGGQMVVPDIIKFDKEYSKIETYKNQSTDVIRLNYKDDTSNNITNHFKLIYLDPFTHLPIKIINSLISLNRKQVQVEILSNIKVNDTAINDIDDKNYLSSYSLKIPEQKPIESLVGKKSLAFVLNSFSGDKISLNTFKGKVILLDFWETWCGPCVQSMPKVEALFKKYNKIGLIIFGIMSEEKSLESAKLLVKNKGLTFIDLVGNSDVEKMYNVIGVPKYILIDEEGKIIYESSNGYEESLEKTLKEKFNF
jgi:thiol-disulfide isomerase/thioredoxin